jgi:hypothetical protein
MKLAQYTQSLSEPLRNEDTTSLIRLFSTRNKTARGLSNTIGPVDVCLVFIFGLQLDTEVRRADDTGKEVLTFASRSGTGGTMGINRFEACGLR